MGIRYYDIVIRKFRSTSVVAPLNKNVSVRTSMLSNLSLDPDENYIEEANEAAVYIFDEYLRKDARCFVEINDSLRC